MSHGEGLAPCPNTEVELNLTSCPPRRQAAVVGCLQVREWARRVTPLNSPSIDLMTGRQDDSAEEIDSLPSPTAPVREPVPMLHHSLPTSAAFTSGIIPGSGIDNGGQSQTAIRADQDRAYNASLFIDRMRTLRNWIGSRDGATGYFRISLHGAPEMPPSWLMHDMSLHEMVITVDATVDIQWNLNGPEAESV